MKHIALNANFINKSKVIRDVHKANPGATNKHIRRVVKELWGINVESNLIQSCIGKESTRIKLLPKRGLLIKKAKEFLSECYSDLDQVNQLFREALS